MKMNKRTVAIGITLGCATLSAVLLLAGYGARISTSPAYGGSAPIHNSALVTQVHNQADVTFVERMTPYNSRAVAMSKLAPDHGGDAQVKSLAARIQTVQQAATDQMNGFMQVWNSTTAVNPGSPDDMTVPPMPAMMSPETMTQLGSTTGSTFDKMFLRMMTAQHVAAIAMSQTEASDGLNPEAKTLAQRMVVAQQSEIVEMRAMGRRLDHGGGGW